MQALEIIARTIDDRSGFALSGCMDAMMRHDADMNEAALAIVAALEASGYVIVPVEPSEAMLDASWKQTGESKEMRSRTHTHYARHYRAMMAAKDI